MLKVIYQRKPRFAISSTKWRFEYCEYSTNQYTTIEKISEVWNHNDYTLIGDFK